MKFTSLLHLCTAFLLSLPVMAQTSRSGSPDEGRRESTVEERTIDERIAPPDAPISPIEPIEAIEPIEEIEAIQEIEAIGEIEPIAPMDDIVIDLADPLGEIDSDELFIDAPSRLQQLNLDSLRTALKVRIRQNAQEGAELNRRIQQLSRDIERKMQKYMQLRENSAEAREVDQALDQARSELETARESVRELMQKKHTERAMGRPARRGFTMTVINDSANGVHTSNFMMVLDGDSSSQAKGVSVFTSKSLGGGKNCSKVIVSHAFSDSLSKDFPCGMMINKIVTEDSVTGMSIPMHGMQAERIMTLVPNHGIPANGEDVTILNHAGAHGTHGLVIRSSSDLALGRRMQSIHFSTSINCQGAMGTLPLLSDSSAVVHLAKIADMGHWIVVGRDSVRIRDDKDAQMVIRVDTLANNGRTRIVVISMTRNKLEPKESTEVTSDRTSSVAAATSTGHVLEANRPNPFSESTTIDFTLPQPAHTTLTVFDVNGNTIKVLADEQLPAGTHSRRFDAQGLPSGVYLYRLVAGSFSETKTMTVGR